MTGIQGRQGAGGQGRQGYRRDREDIENRVDSGSTGDARIDEEYREYWGD